MHRLPEWQGSGIMMMGRNMITAFTLEIHAQFHKGL